jgi:hypothetical protein
MSQEVSYNDAMTAIHVHGHAAIIAAMPDSLIVDNELEAVGHRVDRAAMGQQLTDMCQHETFLLRNQDQLVAALREPAARRAHRS